MSAEDWWTLVFRQFDNGIVAEAYRRLLGSALRLYTGNQVFIDLSGRYLTPPAASTSPDASALPATCHIIIRASDEDERGAAEQALTELGLGPDEIWSTEHAVSYGVNSTDVELVRRALGRTGLGWTVVPPGQPDYLLRELFVQGPDGSRFQFTDAPAAQTIRNVAAEVVGQYEGSDATDATLPTVADRVLADGERRRVDMDSTLHDAGFQDGDSMRVGFEGRAGAVNSIDQEDALDRVYHQITGYAKAHPGVTVRANRMTRPTEYEIDFAQDSFGPPDQDGGEPHRIHRHTLLVQLGPEFPVKPPSVFFLTPIFHPNVFPNYDCELSRRDPNAQGLVCLGMLADAWNPAADFGEVIQMLVAIAGYRNYALFESTGEWGPDGPQLRANFYDRTAAQWAQTHQSEIVTMIGGTPIVPRPLTEPGYPNVITRLGRDVDAQLG